MNAVFVNYAHPATQHVSGLRVPRFAEAISRRGHRVVLLTPICGDTDKPDVPNGLPRRLELHDWRQPLLVTCRPTRRWSLSLVRSNRLPRPISKAVTLWHLLAHGGVHTDWVESARPFFGVLAERFRPELVWATFGHSSNMVLGMQLAQRSRCRWIADVKDNLNVFLPARVRPVLAHRLRSCAGVTANARKHAAIAERFFGTESQVVYSGVSPEMLEARPEDIDPATFRLMLVGSVYRDDTCLEFLNTCAFWWRTLPPSAAAKVEIRYAGADRERVARLGSDAGLGAVLVLDGYIPLGRLGALAKSAALNCYIWADFGYHHKAIELLSLGRPVLAYPGESAESAAQAAELGGELLVPSTPATLMEVLAAVYRQWQAGTLSTVKTNADHLSWDARASRLESVFQTILSS